MSNYGVLDTRFRSALARMAERGRLTAYTAPVDPSGSTKCCYPPCTNGVPTLANCGNGTQPCNCTGAGSAC